MTYFQDLTPCTYGPFSRLAPLLAVGWLEPPFDFPHGAVKRAIRDRLQALSSAPFLPICFMGTHACGFCVQAARVDPVSADRGLGELPRGSANILIPGRDVVFVLPELILHYIDEHQYCPPNALTDAIAACPPMGSRGYFLALMETGGDMPGLVEQWGALEKYLADETEFYTGDARQAARLWRNPLWRAWRRLVRR